MRSDLIKAKELLGSGHACAVCGNGIAVSFDGRGIAPLLDAVTHLGNFSGYTVCDKVIGSAAAFVLMEACAKEVYANTVSRRAVSLLLSAGITVSYGNITDFIKNRRGDDLCPMEKKALEMNCADGAYRIFTARLKELQNDNHSKNQN